MIHSDQPHSSIALFGQPHLLWPVAILLGNSLPPQTSLTIVEDTCGPLTSTALTLACANPFHKRIGIEAEELIRHCNGRYGLGTDCRDWHGSGSSFFAAPSGTLPTINGVALHHLMLRAARLYDEPEKLDYLLQPFRFAARTALAGKFAHQADDPDSPLAMLGPTIQMDQSQYASLLKRHFQANGARIVDGHPMDLDIDPDTGAIHSVRISDQQDITADLFIDVSGRLSALLPEASKRDFHSESALLPFDRRISGYRVTPRKQDHNHTIARAVPGGMLVDTPLGTGAISELLFSSAAIEEDAARQQLGKDAQASDFAPWSAVTPWTGNLARLGDASASLGPYLSADMLLLHQQAMHLVESLPASRQMDIEATEYNRKQNASFAQIRDFVCLPFALNCRPEDLWQGVRKAELSENLQIRLDQFKSRGRFVTFDAELFDQQSWIDMMIGFGITPERFDPIAETMDMNRIAPILKRMADSFTTAIAAMADH
jgi:tryptophan halogenase